MGKIIATVICAVIYGVVIAVGLIVLGVVVFRFMGAVAKIILN